MTIQLSVKARNDRLDALETTLGPSAVMKIFSGAAPANVAAANSGTVLATLNLPADFMADAASGQKTKSGTWQDLEADATGAAGHFRLYEDDGVTCHMQGTVTITGGGGDMQVDNTSFAAGQQFTVTAFTLNEPNA